MSEPFDSLITDRTLDDVQNRTKKGVYNVSDLNRVENATAYLAGEMVSLPDELKSYAQTLGVDWNEFYNVPYDTEDLDLSIKTDWTITNIPDNVDSERFLGNIIGLCEKLGCDISDLPKSLDRLLYRDANVIETCLQQAGGVFDDLKNTRINHLTATAKAWPIAGEIYVGEMIT